jgi:hypothetical protein
MFVVDDLPLGINDCLVISNGIHTDFGIVLFSFEFKFHIERKDEGIGKGFGLLLWLLVRVGRTRNFEQLT